MYDLLKKIVEDYSINEIYSSQWISLYLKHILQTTSSNQVGADQFVTQLVDQNSKILEDQISLNTIENFIQVCPKGSETPRLLKLLTALCSCNGRPITEN